MNLVGKILVVGLFVMALVFASFTLAIHATHKNWKMALDNPNPNKQKGENPGALQVLADRDTQIARMQADLTDKQQKLTRTINESEQRLATMESANNELLAARKRLDTEIADKSSALKEAVDNSSKAATVLQSTQDENKKLRDQNVVLTKDRDDSLESVVKLQDVVAQATGEWNRLQERNRLLLIQLAQHRMVIQDARLPLILETPTVNGLVTKTHTAEKLLQINLGTDDGLKPGDKMDVYRFGSTAAAVRYLGQIKLTRVDKTEAVGSIIKSEATIQERDHVATRIVE